VWDGGCRNVVCGCKFALYFDNVLQTHCCMWGSSVHIAGVGGFVKGLGRILAVVYLALALGGGGCAFAQETKGSSTGAEVFCGNPKKVLFGFDDPNHTKLLVPEAYLYDPFGLYYAPDVDKKAMRFVSVSMRKSNGQPNCLHLSENNFEFINISIRPSSKQSFRLIQDGHQAHKAKLYKINKIYDGFFIYRDSNKNLAPWEVRDLFVPINGNLKNSWFAECVHSFNRPYNLLGCHVFSQVNKTMLLIM